jgi:hypothetical protein
MRGVYHKGQDRSKGVWGCGSMGAWKWGEDGPAQAPGIAVADVVDPALAEAVTCSLLQGNLARDVGRQQPLETSAGDGPVIVVEGAAPHRPGVVSPLQPLSQTESRVEQPAGEGEAMRAGKVVGHR